MSLISRPRLLIIASVLAMLGASCSGSLVLDPVGSVRHPELGPPTFRVVVLAGDDLSPLGDAALLVDARPVIVDAEGTAEVRWPDRGVEINVSAPGFHDSPIMLERYPEAGRVEFRLDPVVLGGRVTTPDGTALPDATVRLGAAQDDTDGEGQFRLERAIPGDIELSRPAWEDIAYTWDGSTDKLDVIMNPLELHALRVGGDRIGDPDGWAEVLSLASVTGVDAAVIDIKDEFGTVLHDTEVARAHEMGAVKAFYDIDDVVRDLDEGEIYKIARVVVFQDSIMARAEPDHAVKTEAGTLWETAAGQHWLDPTDPASFEYSIELAAEACNRGFDEVQFDYVTFPFGGDTTSVTFDGAYTEEVRVASITAYLERAYSVLEPLDCAVGANVLAITLESHSDEGVGQRPGPMSRTVDVLSPMIYTSNYGPGWKGFEDPNEHAVEIVDAALLAGTRKLEGFAYYRPWLQTWVISAGAVRDVERVAEDYGMGWMLWSNASVYSAGILPSS
jgi:hypothetical protein